MMTQPSGAAGAKPACATVLGGASADGHEGAGAELQCAPGGTNPAPFSQALLAVAAGTDPAGALLAAAGAAVVATGSRSLTTAQASTDTAAPVAATSAEGADALPKDLLLALFAATAVAAEAGGEQRKTGLAGIDAARAAAALRELQAGTTWPDQSATAQAAPADPGAALLAAVLQWLQQQHAGSRDASASTANSGGGRDSVTDATAMATGAAATTAPIADGATIMAGAGRADGASAAGTMLTVTSGATLASQFGAQRDGHGRSPSGDQPYTPAALADSASSAGTGMDMAAALRAASAASPAQVERSVAVPVHERHWPMALATQVLVLSNDKVQAATLRLSPEHLGPVEVRIDMQEANVNVSFSAAHAETRAALEQAMPQLRAVLAGAGLSLGQATVQQQGRRESQNSNAPPRSGGTADEQIEAPAALTRALGMIDEYV
jgi:flagellar hook-length control protein FliK